MKHTYKIALRYNDSDQMGVVYHGNYFTFFEQGRTNMLKAYGIDYYEIEKRGYLFPVRDVDCTYLKSIRLGEEVYCETTLLNVSKVRFDFYHEIKDNFGVLKAKGTTSIITVRKSDFKIVKMDQHLPDVYKIKDEIKK